MRVAVVHGYYSSRVPSGENVVVDLQVEALRAGGHDVEVFPLRQDEVERARGYVLGAAWRAATGRGPAPDLAGFAPDVVHVHNLFPNYGRRWVGAHARHLVATLHNYRPICPAATLFRDGHGCTECPDAGAALPAVVHGCYRDGRAATVPVALGTRFADDPVLRSAARLVTLNDDMRAHYVAVGVPPDRLVTVPNFVRGTGPEPADGADREHWLYVGRLSEEKGVLPMVERWPAGHRLLVAGSGPLEQEVRSAAGPDVTVLGLVEHERVLELLAAARGLVFPSLWPEGLPTVYLEALAAGTPVLASPESVVGRLVADEGTGLVARGPWSRDLAAAEELFPRLHERCRRTFDEAYAESVWLSRMTAVYETVASR